MRTTLGSPVALRGEVDGREGTIAARGEVDERLCDDGGHVFEENKLVR